MKTYKRLVVIFTCFFLLFLSCAKDEALAACPSDTVKIGGHPNTFTSIQDAYNYASTNLDPPIFTLQLAGGIFTEDLTLNGGAVVLDGGYDCSFINKSSNSYVNGTITIGSGSLTYASDTGALAFTSSTQCEFDRDGDGYSSIGSCSGTANDCDDNDPNTYPGAPEICDGLDNSCEGQIDEGLMPIDVDGDGYYAIDSCGAGLDDCNDANSNINPGALDTPYDGIDQDCSGTDLTFAEGNDCIGCHVPVDGMSAIHNSSALATDTTCVLCHAVPVSNLLSGHYGDTVRTAGNNMAAGATITCYSCHDTDQYNHSGAIALGNGTNTVWGQVATLGAYVANLSCDSCHQDRASGHDTVTAHNNRIIESGCGDCHTSDNSTLGSAGSGTLASAADFDALHGVVSAASCALCHNYTGTRLEAGTVRQTIQQGLDGTPVSCTDCHVAQRTNHYQGFTHSGEAGPNDLSYDAPGQPCGNCHVVANWTQIESIEHNVPTNGAGSCATCHNSPRQEVIDALALGDTPTYCLDCHSDLYLTRHVDHVALDYVTDTTTCLSCHDSDSVNNGTVTAIHLNNCLHCHTDKTSLALQPGIPVGGGECVTCHTDGWDVEHTPAAIDHTVLVTVGSTRCADCHDDTLISAANLTHNGCGSCHDANGALLGSAFGTSFAISGDCTSCHTGTWEAEHTPATDHTGLVTVAATSCADCHDDTLISAATTTHIACGSCHDADGGLIGSAIGQTGSGDCTSCHSSDWDALHPTTTTDHSVLVTVGASSCAACHDDTLTSAATDTHNDCTSCHDAATGALIGSAVGNPAPSDCTTCHTGTWEALHPTTTTDHSVLVTVGASSCASCHDDTLVSAAPETHNACVSCHDATSGALIGSAVGNSAPSDCTTCHGVTFDTLHAGHTHTVSESAADLSYDPPGQLCSNCHVVSTWSDINDIEHNVATNGTGSCSTCHNSPRQEVIDAITLATDPTVCLDCHSNKLLTVHGNEDHDALGYVTFGATSCQTCHDPGVASDETVTVIHLGTCSHCHTSAPTLQAGIPAGGGECITCHTDTWGAEHTPAIDHTALVTVGATDCASCHDDTLVSAAADTHNACTSCHDGDGGLVSTAVGTNFTDGGDCATCHGSDWNALHPTTNFNHGGLVTVGATGCADCHSDTLVSAATETHNACTSCHDATSGALIGSAFNQTGSGDCTTCHSNTWEAVHPTTAFNHGGLVTVGATDCASCHDNTLVSAAADTHNACISCHDATSGILIGSAISQTGSGDCATCHSGTWQALHPTTVTDHSGIVTVGTTDCASCHDDTLVSAAPETHDACISCHDAINGALIGAAIGNPTPTDCTTCHGSNWEPTHTGYTHTVALGSGDLTDGVSCGACHVVATWAEIDGTEHNVPTNGASSCSTCHSSPRQEVIDTIALGANPTNCLPCHTGKDVTHGSIDHVALGYVTTGPATCATCHDPGAAADATVSVTHLDNCALCHTTVPALQPGIPANGGDCATCHGGTWEAEHTPATDHTALVSVGATDCASCHDDTLVSAAADTHNACTSCHDGDGGLVSSAVGTNFTDGGDCATCHGSDWNALHPTTNFNHGGLVTVGATGCADCHSDTLVSAATETHNACTSCHDATSGALIGSAFNQTGSGDCTTCHSNTWEAVHPTTAFNHGGLVTVGATDCASCHDNTLVSAAADTHNACISCHDATSGILIGSAISQTGSGDCATCHSGTWQALHPTTVTDHSGIVTVGTTDCASCHDDTLVSAAPETHDACISCHDAINGALIGAAIGNPTPTDCTTCHGSNWEPTHTGYTHTVALGSGDLTDGVSCGACHVVATWAEIDGTEHNVPTNGASSCSTCHSSPRQEVIDAIALGANPTNCLPCHTGKDVTHGSIDHVALGYVTTGPATCATCHDPGAAADATVSVTHLDNCALCHTTVPALQPGIPANGGDCATCHGGTWEAEHTPATDHTALVSVGATDCAGCHDDTLVSAAADTHNACVSCHDTDGGLVSTAVGTNFTDGGDCATCHGSDWNALHPTTNFNHGGLVTVGATGCADCHTDTLVSAAAETHNACTSCHNAATGALIGSAFNQSGSGDCTTCHTGTWAGTHTTDPGHTGITVGATGCASCHNDTPFIDPGDTTNHNACVSCHDTASGALIGSAIGNPTPTDCSTCHNGGWEAEHTPATDHTALVTVGTTDCASCHDDTLVSAAADTHTACVSCHDADGGLVSTAVGTNFTDGGDCATCHTGTWAGTHTTDPGHTGITVGATGCVSCHDDTLVSAAADTHNACTSCHDATSGALIGAAVGNPTPTDCTTCHTGTWAGTHTTDPGHTGITVGATGCASCHSDTPFIDPGDTTNHDACISCHDTTSGALIGSAVGNPTPTDCATCHTGTWDALHTNHGHTVALGAADLSGGTSCGTCHTAASWTEIDTKHNVDTNGAGSCATCHNSARQEVIDAIALAANPTNCLPCHSDKSIPHAAHITAGYVTVGGVQDYYGTTCASCHDTGGTVNETVDITHGGDCSLCHTTVPNLQPGIPAGGGDCASCHTGSVHTLWERYQSSCGTAACHDMNGGPGNAMHDLHNAGGWSDRNSASSGMIYPYATNPEMWIANWPLNPDCSTCHAPYDAAERGGCGNCHSFPGKGDLHARHADRASKGGMGISCASCHKN